MTVLRNIISASVLFAACAGFQSAASAQTVKQASLSTSKSATAASSWACQAKVVEIAPVSQDTNGRPTAWVMVHRVQGEIIAAERLSASEVEQVRRLPCQGDRMEAPPPLVG
ncbi:MAG: hypothetical protein Q8R82_12285 [Hyphomonadaceae bacterium]|nr:hypothetical protein [Hyphomonadaceae bacterium]